MLPADQRLTSPADFSDVVRRGHRSGGPVVVAHLLIPATDEPSGSPRVGFVVSKAVGPAVTRNLVKRRLRHLLRDRIHRLPGGALLVLRAQPAAARADWAELGTEVDRVLDRVLARVA